MIKLINNFWFKILLAPIMGVAGIWAMVNLSSDKGSIIPGLIIVFGLALSLISAMFTYKGKDV